VEDFQSAGMVETANELVAADIIHNAGPAWTRTGTTGRVGAKGFITMLRAAFPDPHAVIHDQIGEGDEVVTRKSFYGTHRGEFWQSQRRNARAVDSVPSRAPMPAILEGWAGHG
jgi:hypothetical protein